MCEIILKEKKCPKALLVVNVNEWAASANCNEKLLLCIKYKQVHHQFEFLLLTLKDYEY